ncbi:uncharacterized protein BDR25DRAFT_356844 [Lindgomyces ingoldianus]|uniref:Uncharacterized protein n=1 Tax=Lindgomyces ingoldianus TaxID=673940 RepID=A0ACB6QQ81_9PLEO|nr:uncharacterized protein BDR25DRAFT_356844 [Lindgomyces ingoldianus]KAF2469076.1 hypothetical protein BDR25DRAFT_356844 [Lindgomyces ingoldianus]
MKLRQRAPDQSFYLSRPHQSLSELPRTLLRQGDINVKTGSQWIARPQIAIHENHCKDIVKHPVVSEHTPSPLLLDDIPHTTTTHNPANNNQYISLNSCSRISFLLLRRFHFLSPLFPLSFLPGVNLIVHIQSRLRESNNASSPTNFELRPEHKKTDGRLLLALLKMILALDMVIFVFAEGVLKFTDSGCSHSDWLSYSCCWGRDFSSLNSFCTSLTLDRRVSRSQPYVIRYNLPN